MPFKFTVRGVQATIRKLDQLERKVRTKIVREAMTKGLQPILEEAKRLVPVDTGALRDNIKIRAGKGRRGVISREVRVGDKQMDPWYGAVVELGSSRTAPHPFLGPAAEHKGREAATIAALEIARGISRSVSIRGRIAEGVANVRKSRAAKRAKKAARRLSRARKAAVRKLKRAKKVAIRQAKRAGKVVSKRFRKGRRRR